MSRYNGVLPVDKPAGPTSHDAVGAARRALGERRIGHSGTLDPFATGLLLLCVGPATRLAEYLTTLPKRYTATVRLGVATDSDDLSGEVVARSDQWTDLTRERVEEALRAQVGVIMQRPPAFSAKRVGGERMYRAARRGEAVEAAPVEVRIASINILAFELPDVEIEVECGSGTYIRAIARDLGDELAVGGHLAALRRTRIGDFDVEGAVELDQLSNEAVVTAAFLSPAAALGHLPSISLDDRELAAVLNGRAIEGAGVGDAEPLALIGPAGDLVAIGSSRSGVIRPRKVFG